MDGEFKKISPEDGAKYRDRVLVALSLQALDELISCQSCELRWTCDMFNQVKYCSDWSEEDN